MIVERGGDLVADQYVGIREDRTCQGGDGLGVGLVGWQVAQALRRTGDLLVDGTPFVERVSLFRPSGLSSLQRECGEEQCGDGLPSG